MFVPRFGFTALDSATFLAKGVDAVMERRISPSFRTAWRGPWGPTSAGKSGAAIHVHILGPLRVLRDGSQLREETFARPQVRALLGYLAMHHPRPVPAAELVESLWPQAGSIEESSLYTTVSRLRRALGRDVVLKGCTGYRLSPAVEVDLSQFTCALSAQPARLLDALKLWRGELLADLPLAEWCFVARDTYRNRFLEAATRLGESSLAKEDYDAAQAVFERALEVDPTCERAVRGLIKVLVLTGDAPRAMHLFRHFTETLERELGLAPSEETARLVLRIVS